MYFRLNPECYFINGASTGAIYDLIEGDIYSLTPEESQIIRNCENNAVIDGNNPFLSSLKSRCLGTFYENRVYIEKLRIGSPIEEMQPGRPPNVNRAFLEINNSCDRTCWYCGYYGVTRSAGCIGCNKWDETGDGLGVERWKKIIGELHDLDCSMLYLTGGDLTRVWDETVEILQYAKGKFKSIFIILTRENFTEDVKKDIKDIALPIIQTDTLLDSDTETMHHLIIEQENVDKIPRVPENVGVELVSRNFKKLIPTSPLTAREKIPRTDIYAFSRNRKVHSCMGNSLTITWRGDILPCPMMRNHTLGNIRDAALHTIFRQNLEEIEKFWNLRLDAVQRCKNCEYKYACNDCRALEESITESLTGKVLCNYDPAAGTWI